MLAAVIAGVVVLALLGLLAFRVLQGSGPSGTLPLDDDVVTERPLLPAVEPTSSAEETASSGEATSSGHAVDGGPDAGTGGASVVKRAPYIAYRLDGAVWRAREDGTGAVKVAASEEGAFALSPDATVLALVDGGRLSLHDIASGSATHVGEADAAGGLRWFWDSSALLFVRGAPGAGAGGEVLRVGRRGGGPVFVVRGTLPAVTVDGIVVVAVSEGSGADLDRRGSIGVVRPGKDVLMLRARGRVVSLDVAGDRIVYATAGAEATRAGSGAELWSMGLDGGDERRLLGPPENARPFGYGSACASPDGEMVVVAEVGDDGYSRAKVVSVADGRTVGLTVRRDTYPMCWSSDGSRVFLVEGNVFQGEKTSLVGVEPDGMGRRTVVEGAGL